MPPRRRAPAGVHRASVAGTSEAHGEETAVFIFFFAQYLQARGVYRRAVVRVAVMAYIVMAYIRGRDGDVVMTYIVMAHIV